MRPAALRNTCACLSIVKHDGHHLFGKSAANDRPLKGHVLASRSSELVRRDVNRFQGASLSEFQRANRYTVRYTRANTPNDDLKTTETRFVIRLLARIGIEHVKY